MTVHLDEFHEPQDIFIDANIFTYFALRNPIYQTACTNFLARVEEGSVHAVTTQFVLNETFYALLVGKGSEVLGTTKIKRIKEHLTKDASLAEQCYQVCADFHVYISALQSKGLRIVDVGYELQVAALEMGSRYCLLPTDALHVATCQLHNINHMATCDSHFERIPWLQVWKPRAIR